MKPNRRDMGDQYHNEYQQYNSRSRQISTHPHGHRDSRNFNNHRYQPHHNAYDMNMNMNTNINMNMNRNDEFDNFDNQYTEPQSFSNYSSSRITKRDHCLNITNKVDLQQQYDILRQIKQEREKLEYERRKLKHQQKLYESYNQEENDNYKSNKNMNQYKRSLPSQCPTVTEVIKRKHIPNAPQIHKLREKRAEELGYIKLITKDIEGTCPGKGGLCNKHGGKLCRHIFCNGCNKGISSASAAQTSHHLENAYHTSKGHLDDIKLSTTCTNLRDESPLTNTVNC